MATFASVAADFVEARIRFRQQYAAHREGVTPSADFYQAENAWKNKLCHTLGIVSLADLKAEFWALGTQVRQALEDKVIRAGPQLHGAGATVMRHTYVRSGI